MALSMYRASIPVFVQYLTALNVLLTKASAYCEAKKVEPTVLTGTRLVPDMFALARQVQIATDHAKGAAARLSGTEVPSYADTETTLDELKARVTKTLDFIQSIKPEEFDGSDDRDVTLKAGPQVLNFKGEPYLTTFALPNFFFHLTTAYAILRSAGVEVGKRDFLGM